VTVPAPARPRPATPAGLAFVHLGLRLFPWVSLVLLWELITVTGMVSTALVPTPVQVLSTFWHQLTAQGLWLDVYMSCQRVVLGLVCGITLAIPVAFLVGWYRGAHRLIDPLINFFRSLPPIALIPLVIVYFGIGEIAASAFPSATIVDGWGARNDFYDTRKEVLKRVIRAWIAANDMLINQPQEALGILHDKYYSNIGAADVQEMYKAAKWYSTKQWAQYYGDGSVAKWLNQVTEFNVEIGAIQNPVMADKYFDPGLYLEVAGSNPK